MTTRSALGTDRRQCVAQLLDLEILFGQDSGMQFTRLLASGTRAFESAS